jgi:hydrogenase nickel incorporation protein HypA/HybF
MHEVGVMQDALEIALEQAARQGARQIHRLALRVGPLSGVVPEALEFAFDVVARGTIAQGAQFVVDRVPLVCACAACGLEFRPPDFDSECPRCHAFGARVRQGRELELAYLEVS